MGEAELLKQIQMSFTNLGARIFRNNTGMGWAGKATQYKNNTTVKVGPGDVLIRNARPVRFGLCVGSSDLIGWTTNTITNEMVGSQVAVFTAIEAKTGKLTATDEQRQFVQAVNQAGGYAGVVRTVSEAVEVINGF